jgi:predicted GIY-YIG superfamily endonuclease
MYTVYIIRSQRKDWVYIGMTSNLEQRLEQHNRGYNPSTKFYRPYLLLHTETFNTSFEARVREKYLKTASGKRWIKKMWPYKAIQ